MRVRERKRGKGNGEEGERGKGNGEDRRRGEGERDWRWRRWKTRKGEERERGTDVGSRINRNSLYLQL